jgi:hypothetical protein
MQRLEAQQIEQAVRAEPRLAYLIERFNRAVDAQNRRDTEIITSLTRTLRNPRGSDAERFIELLRAIVQDEKRS